MKNIYVSDAIKKTKEDEEIELLGWIKSKHDLGGIIFLNIEDSSGSIGAYAKRGESSSELFSMISNTPSESSELV